MTPRITGFVAIAALAFGSIFWTALGPFPAFRLHANSAVAVDLKWLTSFPADNDPRDEDIPPQFRALNGKKVSLEGFLVPTRDKPFNARACQLIYNSTGDYYGRNDLRERVFLTIPSAGTLPADLDISQEIRVVGTLHVGVLRDPQTKRAVSIYRMDVDQIEKP
jgi:hypothetical protein